MKRTPLTRNPDSIREWEERTRQRQIEAQKGAARSARIKTRRKSKRAHDAKFAVQYGSQARVRAIAAMPCCVPGCGRRPSHNHHTRAGGVGMKAGWETICPLCSLHHDAYHRMGYYTFATRYGVDVREVAETLAREVRP